MKKNTAQQGLFSRPRAVETKKRATWQPAKPKARTVTVSSGRRIVRVKAYTVPAHSRKAPKKR